MQFLQSQNRFFGIAEFLVAVMVAAVVDEIFSGGEVIGQRRNATGARLKAIQHRRSQRLRFGRRR